MHKKVSMKKIASSIILIFIVGYAAIAQDTITKADPKPLKMKYAPNPDSKWSMFGMRLHMQDFGITNQYVDTCNCDDGLPLLDRANGTVAFSLYRNLSKRFAVSGDMGISYGHISKKTPTLNDKRQIWFQTARADFYYQFTNNKLQLQPFVFGGAHFSRRSSSNYLSIPNALSIASHISFGAATHEHQLNFLPHTSQNVRFSPKIVSNLSLNSFFGITNGLALLPLPPSLMCYFFLWIIQLYFHPRVTTCNKS
jgi:hypothetical protein